MSNRFTAMDLAAANKECSSRDKIYFDDCPRCEMRLGIHCRLCEIAVTGCFCTETDRFGKNEAIKRLVDRLGLDAAKAKLQKNGFWTPPNAGTE